MRSLRDRFHDVDLVETPDVFFDAVRREPSLLGVEDKPSKGRAAVIVVSLALAVVGVGFAVRAFQPASFMPQGGRVLPADSTVAQTDLPQEAPPDAHVDFVCDEDGTTTAQSKVLTATREGVPVTVWSSTGGRLFWVALPNWMPVDDQAFSLQEGENSFTVLAPPGDTRMGCVDAAHAGTLDPDSSTFVFIADPESVFGPAEVDCGARTLRRSVFDILSQIPPRELANGLPKEAGLEETIRSYLSGIVGTDVITPAMYPASPYLESELVTRNDRPLALVSRAVAGPDVPSRLRVVTCQGSGVGQGG